MLYRKSGFSKITGLTFTGLVDKLITIPGQANHEAAGQIELYHGRSGRARSGRAVWPGQFQPCQGRLGKAVPGPVRMGQARSAGSQVESGLVRWS
jgi:hypothetical protein